MLRHALAGLLTAVLTAAGTGAAWAQARIGQPAPEITGERWLNSDPLSIADLRGRVVLIDFWTYG